MRYGVIYPQTEFGHDPAAIRDYAQTVEELGFDHLATFEHVLGANPERPEGYRGPYDYRAEFLEPFVLFGYLAAATRRIELVTGVLVLPQRQTALVAKQAATLDLLCGGRLRLGVGVGWNAYEYAALGEDFHTRGRRIEEQVMLLRRLWSEPLITLEGRWHRVPDMGLNPQPGRAIPIWFGGHAEPVLRRVARLGDGWMPTHRSPADAQPALEQLWRLVEEAGRPREAIGIEARLPYGGGNPDEWATLVTGWQAAGATHLSLNTMRVGFDKPAAHLAALRRFAEALGLTQAKG
jgi:probable F420-dependent oxidoreductase